jgi:predicted nuclease with TOPRIM domain
MPRVIHVKKARKNYKDTGIKKGDSYYYWKFNFDRTIHRSLTAPTPQQLTKSDFLIAVYDIRDRIDALSFHDLLEDVESLKSEVESICEEIRNLAEEQTEKRDNMPDSLQDAPTGEMLQGRADSLEEWADELECVNIEDYDETDSDVPEGLKKAERRNFIEEETRIYFENIINELQACSYSGE